MGSGLIYNPRKAEPSVLFVRVQSGLAKYLRQLTACGPPLHVHLAETIARGDIALREIQVVVVGCFDVWNAAFIAPNGDAAVQTRQADTLRGLLGNRARSA